LIPISLTQAQILLSEVRLSAFQVLSNLPRRISLPVDLSDLVNDSNTESLFLIQTLSDDLVIIEDNVLKISFDISAIHNKIYQDRIKYLRQFFEKTNGIKVKSSNGNN